MKAIDQLNYSDNLRLQLKSNLDEFNYRTATTADLKSAAVAITVFQSKNPQNNQLEPAIIMTRRTARLNNHSGQWALPGGRLDAGETETEAALREMREEINLDLGPAATDETGQLNHQNAILGRLDDYVTRSGYCVTPIILWAGCNFEDLTPNPDEVASIHSFSLAELCRDDQPILETIAESDRQVLSVHYLDDRIYSPTAAMLYQFREVCLFGRETRVAHFDQPVFAWR